jgi:hypothetical protein
MISTTRQAGFDFPNHGRASVFSGIQNTELSLPKTEAVARELGAEAPVSRSFFTQAELTGALGVPEHHEKGADAE